MPVFFMVCLAYRPFCELYKFDDITKIFVNLSCCVIFTVINYSYNAPDPKSDVLVKLYKRHMVDSSKPSICACFHTISFAGVAELADAPDLGSGGLSMQVQVLSPAPKKYSRNRKEPAFLPGCVLR